jgi:hypothetical protein
MIGDERSRRRWPPQVLADLRDRGLEASATSRGREERFK